MSSLRCLSLAACLAFPLLACSPDAGTSGGGGGTDGGPRDGGGIPPPPPTPPPGTPPGTPPTPPPFPPPPPPSACSSTSVMAEEAFVPVDIIWIVDSSGSMENEAMRVQENLNDFSRAMD